MSEKTLRYWSRCANHGSFPYVHRNRFHFYDLKRLRYLSKTLVASG